MPETEDGPSLRGDTIYLGEGMEACAETEAYAERGADAETPGVRPGRGAQTLREGV